MLNDQCCDIIIKLKYSKTKKPAVGLAFAAIKMYNKDPPRDMTEPVHNSVTAMAIGQPLLAHGNLQETRQ